MGSSLCWFINSGAIVALLLLGLAFVLVVPLEDTLPNITAATLLRLLIENMVSAVVRNVRYLMSATFHSYK